jgi:hypothetical protein
MITVNLILTVLLVLAIAGAIIMGCINYYRHKKNLYVSTELDALILQTLEHLKKPAEVVVDEENPFNLDSPAVLTTILNVLVGKFGDVRLSLQDFMIGDESYVSVYVDGHSKEIILSLNPDLSQEELYSMGAHIDPNDNTFH